MIKLLLKMNCSNILVQGITIIAPVTSPNTDGINPGLCFVQLLKPRQIVEEWA